MCLTDQEKDFLRLEFSVVDTDIKIRAKSIAGDVPAEETVRRMHSVQLLRSIKNIESMLKEFQSTNYDAPSGKDGDEKGQPKDKP